MEASALDLS